MVQVPGVTGRREGRGEVGPTQSELVHRQLAQENASGGFQSGRGGGILRGHPVDIHLGTGRGRNPGSVVQVFQGEGDTVQRSLVAATAYLCFGKPGVIQSLFFQYDDVRVQPVVGGCDAV